MRWTRDDTADVLYIYLLDSPVDHTEELADGTVVDVSSDGSLVGVEILAVSRGWDDAALADRFPLTEYERAAMHAISHPPRPTIAGRWAPGEPDRGATVTSRTTMAGAKRVEVSASGARGCPPA